MSSKAGIPAKDCEQANALTVGPGIKSTVHAPTASESSLGAHAILLVLA